MTLRRLVASKAGFGSFTKVPGFREEVLVVLSHRSNGLTVYADRLKGHQWLQKQRCRCFARSHRCAVCADAGVCSIDMPTTLKLSWQPMHDNYELAQEKENKAVLLASKCAIVPSVICSRSTVIQTVPGASCQDYGRIRRTLCVHTGFVLQFDLVRNWARARWL